MIVLKAHNKIYSGAVHKLFLQLLYELLADKAMPFIARARVILGSSVTFLVKLVMPPMAVGWPQIDQNGGAVYKLFLQFLVRVAGTRAIARVRESSQETALSSAKVRATARAMEGCSAGTM
jgi:hypothetical protein